VTEWMLLGVAVLLVAANAVFVAAEFSLVTVDRATVEAEAAAGDRRSAGVLAALRTLSTQMSGAQFGITVTSLAVGFLAQPSLATLLEGPLGLAGVGDGAMTVVSVLMALAVATVFQMVLGELVPKNLAITHPLRVAHVVAPVQRGFSVATGPLIRGLNGIANALLRAMGIEPQEELRSARSPEELVSLVRRSADQGTLATPTAGLLTRTLAFGERTAVDAMTPRVRVRFVAADDPVQAVLTAARESGHSRFPVMRENVDDVVGLVHVKHALAVPPAERATRPVSEVMVQAVVVPGSVELDTLLGRLRQRGLQMAVVVDEYGGTDGVVTLEDLVEELVGAIADEHDRPGAHARRRADGVWSLSGLLRPDEVGEITGVALPEHDDYETLAGLVLERLEHVPVAGEAVTEETRDHVVTLTVERMDGRRIDRVLVAARPRVAGEDAPDAGGDPGTEGGRP